MKGLKEVPTPPCVQDRSFLFFVSFVVQKLVSTMKGTKSLQETLTLPWMQRQSSPLLLRASSWHSSRLHGQFACMAAALVIYSWACQISQLCVQEV